MSIEKITSRIIGDAEEKKKAVLAEAKAKADEILAAAKKEAEDFLASETARGQQMKETLIERHEINVGNEDLSILFEILITAKIRTGKKSLLQNIR